MRSGRGGSTKPIRCPVLPLQRRHPPSGFSSRPCGLKRPASRGDSAGGTVSAPSFRVLADVSLGQGVPKSRAIFRASVVSSGPRLGPSAGHQSLPGIPGDTFGQDHLYQHSILLFRRSKPGVSSGGARACDSLAPALPCLPRKWIHVWTAGKSGHYESRALGRHDATCVSISLPGQPRNVYLTFWYSSAGVFL